MLSSEAGAVSPPNVNTGSSTVTVVLFTVVVVPLTVKSPVTVKFPPTEALPVVSIVVKSAAAGVVPPMTELSIVPPEIVKSFATYASAIAVPCHVPLAMVPTVTRLESPGYAVASDKSKAGVASEAPKATETPPYETVEFVNELFPMLLKVFEAPLIVLFVKVSVVALPTKVSVEVGKVNVPVLLIELMTGVVKVLFVKVWVPVSVATVESIATVKVLVAPVVSIPVPPAIVNVSLSKSIDNAPPLSP